MHPLYEEFRTILDQENKDACVKWAISKITEGKLDIKTLHTEILSPALNTISCTDENHAVCVWREHVKTSIVRTIIENCYPSILKEREKKGIKPNGKKVIVICPPDEYHEMGARIAADFFTLAGYDITYIGGNTPLDAFLAAIDTIKPNIIAISVSNPYHVSATQKIIHRIREIGPKGLQIIVGGQAFQRNKEVFKQIGADLQINTYEEIIRLEAGH